MENESLLCDFFFTANEPASCSCNLPELPFLAGALSVNAAKCYGTLGDTLATNSISVQHCS